MKAMKFNPPVHGDRDSGGGRYAPPEIFVERIEIESGFAGSATPGGDQLEDLDNWDEWDN